VVLSSADSIELVMIGGLEQADTTWQPANGVYGALGGLTGTWPASLTAGDPDYFFIVPNAGSGVNLGIEAVRKSGLQSAGAANLKFAYQQNTHRLKIDQRGDLSAIPANTTLIFYALQIIARNLTPTQAKSIASDYIAPDSPTVSGGSFTGFSYDDGAYHFQSTNGSTLQFTMAMNAIDSSRWLTEFVVNNWTAATAPSVKVGGVSLVAGSDYVSTVDPTTRTAYVKLLKHLASASAPNTITNGTISLS
jgi:hypothetical protein